MLKVMELLNWSGDVEHSPGCSARLLGLEASFLTPGLGFFRGAKVPRLAKSEVQSYCFFNESRIFIHSTNSS